MIKYNVIYDKQKDITLIQSELENLGVIVHNIFSNIGVMTVSANSTEFSQVEGILTIEEDLVVVPTESFEWHQLRVVSEGLPMLNYYKVTNFGENVNVYVVDSGIDETHSEFSHTTVNNLFSYNSDFTPTNGHGTGVASIIGGNTLGISKNVKLHNVKIPTGTATTYSVLLSAFDAILNHHDAASVAVVNCSWTVPKSQILDTKIIELQNDNLVVVAAAGNVGQAADNYSPVGLNSVLGVGASDAYDRVISWEGGAQSNWGPEVDLFAPGIEVVVANMGSTTMEVSGTSVAAGVVSGVVSQYIIENPTFTASQIQSLVIQQAKEDLLFRNESVYGTTPNRIVVASALKKVILIPEKIDVRKGTTEQLVVEYNTTYAQSVQFDNLTNNVGNKIRLPAWITTSGATLIISPTEDLQSAEYLIPIRALDYNNQKVETRYLTVNVYAESPEETTNSEKYRYMENEAGDSIIVTTAYCPGFTCYNGFGTCYKASFPCLCNSGYQCYTQQGT